MRRCASPVPCRPIEHRAAACARSGAVDLTCASPAARRNAHANSMHRKLVSAVVTVVGVAAVITGGGELPAQVPPSAAQIARYDGLHAAAARGDVREMRTLIQSGADVDAR